MPELRLNLVTREWVIIATERAKRPQDFRTDTGRPLPLPYEKTCPFCPGNERKTADELLRVSGENGWKIRVVSNRYPALSKTGEKRRLVGDSKRMVTGVGLHEVIIETPAHDITPGLLDLSHVEEIIKVYKARFLEAYNDSRVEHVIIFKNHGENAGTSLYHPHSQLVATPIVPIQFRDRVQSAMHYFDDIGECLMCAMIKSELGESRRIILDTQHFLTFVPYAALSPFHTWIFPKRHSASFSDITPEEMKELALHLKNILAKFHYGLDNPDYNYVIRSSSPEASANEYTHWYMSFMPRITKTAGFEIGSGIFINTSMPENSAEFLRSVQIPS